MADQLREAGLKFRELGVDVEEENQAVPKVFRVGLGARDCRERTVAWRSIRKRFRL